MSSLPDTDFASQEVIRPAAVLSESHARLILQGLAHDDVHSGGHWWTRVGSWRRYATSGRLRSISRATASAQWRTSVKDQRGSTRR